MEEKKVTFQILFTSDIHGAFRDYDYASDKATSTGLSRIATLIKQERDNFNGRTFVCDCGDNIQGNGTREIIKRGEYKPYPVFAAFEKIGYDFVVLGNHEFNFGIDDIYACFEGYNGVKVCGNVFKKDDNSYLDGFTPILKNFRMTHVNFRTF